MALSRRGGNRFPASIWPGFVDAMTALLLVLMFVLSIFMIVQFMLRETISGQESELDTLSSELSDLADALGMERNRSADLETSLSELNATLDTAREEGDAQSALIASLTAQISDQENQLSQARSEITSFEAQVASLLVERDTERSANERLSAEVDALENARQQLDTERKGLETALASARTEIDAQSEAARLAAARREALDAMVASLQSDVDAAKARADDLSSRLSDEEAARIADAAAATALRDRLKNAEDELTAMTLALEEQRKKAEDTLTLLAAAQAVEAELDDKLAAALLARLQVEERLQKTASEGDNTAADLLKARTELDETRTALEASQADVVRLTASLAEANAGLTEGNTALDQAASEIVELRQDLSQGQAEIARLTGELEGLRTVSDDASDLRRQLAAALAAKLAAEQETTAEMTRAEERAALLEAANRQLNETEAKSAEDQRKLTLLNEQVAALRSQLGSLQGLLDAAAERDSEAQVQLQALGNQLNTALAQVASEERKRANLEEAERVRLEEEAARLAAEAQELKDQAKDLASYRSEFFGEMQRILGGRQDVRVEGDRFVFSSEVLFEPASADLSPAGRAQIARVAETLSEVAGEIPDEIDWVIRVDGHTDDRPLSGFGAFADNWELSQARALSVVRYMTDALGFPPNRLAANGFGEFQPINTADTEEARAQNRRIELKLTER